MESYNERKNQDSSFEAFREIAEVLREPVGAALNLDAETIKNANIDDLYEFSDVVICKQFEGHDMDWRFTPETAHLMHIISAVSLAHSFSDEDRTLYVTKIVERPLKVMQYKVERMLGQADRVPALDQIKLFVYDGHDTQAVNLLKWLNPSNIEYPAFTEYASQISFELLFSEECLESVETAGEDCFSVQVLFNGKHLELPGCEEVGKCSYPEFKAYLETLWYSGPHTEDLALACQAN